MKRRGTTTEGAVVMGDSENSKGNDNEPYWREPCSMTTEPAFAGRTRKQTRHLDSW